MARIHQPEIADDDSASRVTSTSFAPEQGPGDGHGHGRSRRKRKGPCSSVKYTPAEADPWLQRQIGVGLLIGISIYSAYVVIGRICVPVIQQTSTTGWSRGSGVGTLIGYIIIFLLYAWSYLKMITTSPGFARKFLPEVPPPAQAVQTPFPLQNLAGPAHNQAIVPGHHQADGTAYQYTNEIHLEAPDPSELGPIGQALMPSTTNLDSSSATLHSQTAVSPANVKAYQHHASPFSNEQDTPAPAPLAKWETLERPIPQIQYGPRWCRFCKINKPDRTHHCRHCGTCVMQFDHHCIWIGQCVGWGNHKFFITFCLWGSVFSFYILILSIIYLVRMGDVDGQIIAMIALSALFGLFAFCMLLQHVYLIMHGVSTVESFAGQDQSAHENRFLQSQLGFWGSNRDAKKVKRKWKEEWGGSEVDERWRVGGAATLWRREMGERCIGWLLPIGRPMGDGMHFPQNPKFGPNGEWLRKRDWPDGIA